MIGQLHNVILLRIRELTVPSYIAKYVRNCKIVRVPANKSERNFTTKQMISIDIFLNVYDITELLVHIMIFLIRGLLITKNLLSQGFLVIKFKSSLRTRYGHPHDLVNLYGIAVSQMTNDNFRLSKSQYHPFLIDDLSP